MEGDEDEVPSDSRARSRFFLLLPLTLSSSTASSDDSTCLPVNKKRRDQLQDA